jgi:ubiquinone/menaquinone biosynthesis C-methylase UbiE
MGEAKIFDDWPDQYDQWFETPIGQLVKKYESQLIKEMLQAGSGESILDAGCGTGIFTIDLLAAGAIVVGLELSFPMLSKAVKKLAGYPFRMVQGDMKCLPFDDNEFDKVVSVTAIEFIKDTTGAVNELFRVTKPGGRIVVATLNSLSPWAVRRKASGKDGHPIFKHVRFRAPDEMRALLSVKPEIKTSIHFQKHEEPVRATEIEERGRSEGLETGAFLVARWEKP